MKRLIAFFLACGLLFGTDSAQEDYTFDLSEIKKKPFQMGGHLEFKPVFSLLDQGSRFYLLRYFDRPQTKSSSEFNFKALIDLSYEKGIAKAQMRVKTDLRYFDSDWSNENSIYEGYLSVKPSLHFQVDVGKKRLKWGKGYAWNPVAFIDNPKNPYDPDKALEGFTVISADYIKSFTGPLKTLTVTGVLVPILHNLNSSLGTRDTLNYGGKLYLLLFDTDMDFLFFGGPGVSSRFGVDFSRNITSNFEVHGEWAYLKDFSLRVFDGGGLSFKEKKDTQSFLLGVRYLTKTNTTFFLEYYWNGRGLTGKEMENYYQTIDQGYDLFLNTGDESGLNLASSMIEYRTFTPEKKYLYVRVLQKEPFNIVYFNPSLTSIFNLSDESFSLVPEFLYAPVTDLELRSRAVILLGGKGTEFGEKQNRCRFELRIRYYF
ncbi:MAG: hypothetical protein GF421_09685 [Candidatus Aminicenantes bacterium]|nr:hypothetical protein [Candidatus Aminicenantes bacterium]